MSYQGNQIQVNEKGIRKTYNGLRMTVQIFCDSFGSETC